MEIESQGKPLQKNSVLIVDDEPSGITFLAHILGEEYTIYVAKNGKSAIEITKERLPDVILLDVFMPGADGYAVIAELKNSKETRHIPVIFVTGTCETGAEEKGLALGAADFISKALSPAVVKLRIQNQIKIVNQFRTIERLSTIDQLTDLPNRRSFENRLTAEWGRAQREQISIGILVIDVDHFKRYNDTFGHLQGDVALQAVARIFTQALKRTSDFAARWGGEEFVVLLPNTDVDGAFHVAEHLRKCVEDVKVLCKDGSETRMTVSIGVHAAIPSQNDFWDCFISKADEALYRAKAEGRNRVCVAEKTK